MIYKECDAWMMCWVNSHNWSFWFSMILSRQILFSWESLYILSFFKKKIILNRWSLLYSWEYRQNITFEMYAWQKLKQSWHKNNWKTYHISSPMNKISINKIVTTWLTINKTKIELLNQICFESLFSLAYHLFLILH